MVAVPRQVTQAVMKEHRPDRYREYKRVLKTHGACSAIHGLPKTHKLGPPPTTEQERRQYVEALALRIIAPSYASIDKPLCTHLTAILSALPRPSHSLKNLETGIGVIQSFEPNQNTRLVSFDIKAMYPSISIDKSCSVIQEQLQHWPDLYIHTTLSPNEISILLKWCLQNTYLQTGENEFWKQKKGLAMGKSISSIVAERYMLHLEEKIWTEANHLPGLYLRWVDDTLASWDHGDNLLHNYFIPFLNSLDPDLEWTVETEKNNTINFLDTTIVRHPHRLHTSVYRKACNTRHFIPASSNHPWEHKCSAIQHAFRRAFKYCSTKALLQKEEEDIQAMFRNNGYSTFQIAEARARVKRHLHRSSAPREGDDNKPAPHDVDIKIGLPYIGHWSKQMQRLGIKYNIYFALSNQRTVRRVFPSAKVKQSADLLGGVVYKLHCHCPDGRERPYVGQTGGPLSARRKQHEDDRKGAGGSFSKHPQSHGPSMHFVDFQQMHSIAREDNHPVRVLLEALHIMSLSRKGEDVIDNPNLAERDGPRVNKSDGVKLSPLWQPIAERL